MGCILLEVTKIEIENFSVVCSSRSTTHESWMVTRILALIKLSILLPLLSACSEREGPIACAATDELVLSSCDLYRIKKLL